MKKQKGSVHESFQCIHLSELQETAYLENCCSTKVFLWAGTKGYPNGNHH